VLKEAFLELIQRVKEVSGISLPIIVGSHSLYAITDEVPAIVRASVEADFLLVDDQGVAREKVHKQLGITSAFHDEHGYFADALGLATVTLPPGWRDRLTPLYDPAGQAVARCLEIYDAAVSKLMAGRDKDWLFLAYLLDTQLITLPPLLERAELILETAADGALQPRLEKFLANLQKHHTRYDLTPLHQLIQQLKSR
jgi:hypothetical protein